LSQKDHCIRFFKEGDEQQIIDLLRTVFNGWPQKDLECTPLEHWNWKYSRNPPPNKLIAVAVDNNQVIGTQHGSFSRLKLGNEIILCSKGHDTATHSNYRRMGVFTKTTELREKLRKNADISICLAYPALATRGYYSRNYKELPYKKITYVRIKNFSDHIKHNKVENALLKRVGIALLKVRYRIETLFHSKRNNNIDTLTKKEIETFDERFNFFWENIKGSYDFIFERTQEYLNWRYCDLHGGNYRVLVLEEGNDILGQCIKNKQV
jgi:hypothetical protein